MILPPPSRIGDAHLIAQNVPDDARLDAVGQRLDNRSAVQRSQTQIAREAAAVRTTENLIHQLPKLTFSHKNIIGKPRAYATQARRDEPRRYGDNGQTSRESR